MIQNGISPTNSNQNVTSSLPEGKSPCLWVRSPCFLMEKLVPEPSFDGKAGAGFAAIRGRAWAPNEASAQEHSY